VYVQRLAAVAPAGGALPVPQTGGPPHAADGAALAEPLTGRELEVLARLERGLPNKGIAAELVISPETVKRHAAHVYAKLGVGGRRAAVRRAADPGLLPFG
jgi:LuxR family maltose regulon positive regulatory protein